MKKCLIITGGEFDAVDTNKYDYIIACDKGYDHAIKLGITPNAVIGDLDSYTGRIDSDLNLVKLPVEKDDTDTMYAVRYAFKHDYRDITICCAFGGRLDHSYANIQTAAYVINHGGSVHLLGKDTQMYMIKNNNITIHSVKDSYISVFSYSDKCTGVTLRGMKYCLYEAELTNSFPLGISNEWNDESAMIEVKNGTLCIMISLKS